MADLLTPRELWLWTTDATGLSETETAADPKAAEVIDKVSQLAQFLGGHPEWDLQVGETAAPFDVRMVVLQVCKRSYENTRQVIQEGNVGPIGGDRVADAAALLLSLTESERATLTKYNVDGDPDASGAEIFTWATTRGTDDILTPVTLYVPDDQQVGMTVDESAYPSWDIPLFGPNDPGDPNNYPDGV
jgi:hypothetical protein